LTINMINKRDLLIFYVLINSIQLTNNRLIDNLKQIIDSTIAKNLSDENSTDLLIEELTKILEEEDGLQIFNQTMKNSDRVDGSGEYIDDTEYPPIYVNMSIFTYTIVSYI